jgi:hypothetical protein
MPQGPEFTDIQPVSTSHGGYEGGESFVPNYSGLDLEGSRQRIAGTWDRFRIGQTIFLEFEVFLDVPGSIEAILLRPWWLRPQREFRAVGPETTPDQYIVGPNGNDGVDVVAFGPPDISLAATERVWQTDTIREPIIGVANGVPVGKTFSNMIDNVWRIPIDAALVVPGYSFRKAWYWPAHGYQLAFTSELVGAPGQGAPGEIVRPTLRVSWMTGATHSISQEGIE